MKTTLLALIVLVSHVAVGDENIIEEQLKEIGSIPNDEVVVVQKKYTRKVMRHELSPLGIGGVPFGTVRQTLFGGASYTLHLSDAFAWEGINALYSKNFFTGFTDDINNNKTGSEADIRPDIQKLLFLATTGIQWTPMYGKASTFSSWIAYIEPYISLGLGIAKTETAEYFAFYPGVGIRVFFREWVSMRVEFRDYIYTETFIDRTTSQQTSALRNNYTVMLSLSFWLPKMPG